MEFFVYYMKNCEQGGENLKNLSEHALLLGTSEYDENYHSMKAYTPRDHYRQKLDFLLSDQTLL